MKKNISFLYFFVLFSNFYAWSKDDKGSSKNIIEKVEEAYGYVSSEDDIQAALLTWIRDEKKAIWFASYLLTDKKVADALVEAKKERGVEVCALLSPLSSVWKSGKGRYLRENDIPVLLSTEDLIKPCPFTDPIMHNKYCLFGENKGNYSWLWTGSYNWTCKAAKLNYENAVVLKAPTIVDKFSRDFEHLVKSACLVTKSDHRAKRLVITALKRR